MPRVDPPMPNGEPPCLRSELGCLGSEIGEKVDFHLLVEDKEDEEEASLPVLFPLLLPDFLPGGGGKQCVASSSSRHAGVFISSFFYFKHFLILLLSLSPNLPGPSLLSNDIVAIFLSILDKESNSEKSQQTHTQSDWHHAIKAKNNVGTVDQVIKQQIRRPQQVHCYSFLYF